MFFEIPVTPTAQQRTRHTATGLAYKSQEQRANERTLEALLAQYRPEKPLEGPVRLFFIAYLPVPMSTPKKRLESMLEGKTGHIKKPDLDNLAKQLLDAMTRLQFWHDDRQIVELVARKQYAQMPRWAVDVREQEEA